MSETITAPAEPVASTPVEPVPIVETQVPGPATTGTAPEAAAPPEVATPAPSSSEPGPEPEPTSLLSEATSEPSEKPPVEAKPPTEPQAVAYEPFTIPEGVQLDEKPLGQFTGLLGEYEQKLATPDANSHATMQELGQKLVDFYINETQANAERFAQAQKLNYDRTREAWVSQFREDPEIGQNRQDTTLQRAGAVLELYGQRVGAERVKSLRQVFGFTGAGDHPEVIRFLNWMANYTTESSRMVPASVPRPAATVSRAARLYRNSISNGAA